ncbi:PEP-CTERM sorting domain-containing protein [Coleofasciculus sp.]|uniref:PEP-CTERM sorting domain-containing protein n=1 Tax=Coleofasciculus sp. TaxID=3100458 RepID=UPI0039FAF120
MSFVGKTASVFGVVGLSAIATLGVVESAEAGTVVLGSDYWVTKDSSSFNFPGFGSVDFVGNPIGEFNGNKVGNADTIVERTQDCIFDDNGSCDTGIKVVALSLKSKNPVNGFDIFVNLNENEELPIGTLTIKEDKTFTSNFTVNFTATFKNAGEEEAVDCQGDNCNLPANFGTNSGVWSPIFPGGPKVEGKVGDQAANVHTDLTDDQMDFFAGVKEIVDDNGNPVLDENGDPKIEIVVIEHDASGAGHHDVSPAENVPEPLTILGSATALGFGALLKKQSSRKRNKKDVS